MRPLILFISLFVFLNSNAFAVDTGAKVPDFKGKTSKGEDLSLSDYDGKTIVLEWFNPECPFVKKHYDGGDMQALQKKWTGKDVVWIVVNSTESGHPAYKTPEQTEKIKEKQKIASTAIVLDESGDIAKIFEAKTTPHMYVINQQRTLVYQGAIDDTPGVFAKPKDAKNYVDLALTELAEGKPVTHTESKAYGCSVKYKQ